MQSNIVQRTRRTLPAVIATFALLISLGCNSTPPTPLVERFSYRERIDSILFVPARSKVVVLGERYHYLFDDQKALNKIISASFAKDLLGSFNTFVVLPNNRITGSYQIRTRNPLSPSQKDEAKKLGFIELSDGRFEIATTITGERFTTVPLSSNFEKAMLTRTHTIDVTVLGYNDQKVKPLNPVVQAVGEVAGLLLLPIFVLEMFILY